jgi:peptidoglycan/xylan/chitin deacetylase (PgdA/CDA1 family)
VTAIARVALAATSCVAAPSLVSIGPLRRLATPALAPPGLSGISSGHHVALTFDDGPDRVSTPSFLRLLERLEVRATFFVLGEHLGDGALVREMVGAGHELGVHGWDHRPVALHAPTALREGLRRTRGILEDTTGGAVTWYRPPYGLVTPTSWWAARAAGLTTVLWSAWGRDWEQRATPSSVVRLVGSQVRPGGTVLLHDSDRASAPASWRTTLAATEQLVEHWRSTGLGVGSLAAHWPAGPRPPGSCTARAG